MPQKPIEKQKTREEIFRFIVEYKKRHDGNTPSSREIIANCDANSTSQVHFHIAELVRQGRIRKVDGFRQIEVVGGEWKWHEEYLAVGA